MNLELFGDNDPPEPPGLRVLRRRVAREDQRKLVSLVLSLAEKAPFYPPTMRDGTPFRVKVTSFGSVGWTADAMGYRYVERHPLTGQAWPSIPSEIVTLAIEAAAESGFPGFEPESCLVNLYKGDGRLGLHQDSDELDLKSPIVSVSLGDDCVFRFGGTEKADPTHDWTLRSGDVVVFGGPTRLAWHGLRKIAYGSSDLVPGGGRINLTIRRVTSARI